MHVTAALYKLQSTLKLDRPLDHVKNPKQHFQEAVAAIHVQSWVTKSQNRLLVCCSAFSYQMASYFA